MESIGALGGAGLPVVAHIGDLAMLVAVWALGDGRGAAEIEIIATGITERPLARRAVILDYRRRRRRRSRQRRRRLEGIALDRRRPSWKTQAVGLADHGVFRNIQHAADLRGGRSGRPQALQFGNSLRRPSHHRDPQIRNILWIIPEESQNKVKILTLKIYWKS